MEFLAWWFIGILLFSCVFFVGFLAGYFYRRLWAIELQAEHDAEKEAFKNVVESLRVQVADLKDGGV